MHTVVTTIRNPTECMHHLAEALKRYDAQLIVCGDEKSPSNDGFSVEKWQLACDTEFLSLDAQRKLPFEIVTSLPIGHYSRKNIGYLRAIEAGADCIYETDDDNEPNKVWKPRKPIVRASVLPPNDDLRWVNAYRLFTDKPIWPRGLPLDMIRTPMPDTLLDSGNLKCFSPIQQGLANVAPDVDAVWRLTQGKEFHFPERRRSFLLKRGNWCPFNTQSTWWWPIAYPLLYIPSHCPFRMCDIWKSFVAQRCAWEFSEGIVFHSPEVNQLRNPHNLVDDFEGELQGYLRNNEIAEQLQRLNLLKGEGNVLYNLALCYEALTKIGVFPSEELNLLHLWIADCERLLIK